MRSTFKVLFYVKKGSAKPNGNLPLMCRLTVDGEIKQFSCKMDVSPHLWDVKNNRASGKSAEAQRINRAVDKIRVEVNRRYQELMQTDGYVTAAKLKDAYLGIGIKQETLLKLFEQHNAEFAKKVGHSRAKGTFQRYITVCKHIREFLPHTYKREDMYSRPRQQVSHKKKAVQILGGYFCEVFQRSGSRSRYFSMGVFGGHTVQRSIMSQK